VLVGVGNGGLGVEWGGFGGFFKVGGDEGASSGGLGLEYATSSWFFISFDRLGCGHRMVPDQRGSWISASLLSG